MWRLPRTVPRTMYSDTRWRAVTCSSMVMEDSRQPFTEYTWMQYFPCRNTSVLHPV